MLCHQCGSPVSPDDASCQNCGADLKRVPQSPELGSDGLRRMTEQLQAINTGGRTFPPREEIAERFKLAEIIGKGPFGEVYRASDSVIEADVAVKIFDSELLDDPRQHEHFLKVARQSRTMTQTNVVRVHDGGVHKDHPWISMQALDGLSLRKVLKMRRDKHDTPERARFSLAEMEPIVSQITLAVQHVNRTFPVGTIKPANIIFLPDLIKLTDHYVMAAFDAAAVAQRLSGNAYLSPELARATADPDVRCDVYSLGVIIGEMFFGPNYTPGSPPNGASEAVAMDALCRRATADDPADRYASVEALSEDFVTLVDTGSLLHSGLAEPSEPPPPPRAAPNEQPAPDTMSTPDELETREYGRGGAEAHIGAADGGQPGAKDVAEEEIATREYSRDNPQSGPELGDLLETNDMGRGELPPPVDGPETPSPEASTKDASTKDASTKDASTKDASTKEATATAVKPGPTASKDDDSGVSPSAILAGLVVVAALVGVVIWQSGHEETTSVEIGDSDGSVGLAAASTDDKPAADSQDAGQAGGAPVAVVAVRGKARQAVLAARGQAADRSTQQAAEDAKNKDDAAGLADAAEANAMLQDDDDGADDGANAAADNHASAAKGSASSAGGSAKAANERPAADATDCKAGMLLVKSKRGNYCVDAYEYPARGAKPRTGVSWFKAKQLCGAKGKRLCTLSEWKGACGQKYPYGKSWDPDRCNTVDEDAFARSLAAAGKFSGCRSWTGAHDMTGNAHEWVAEQRIAGGGFDSGPEVATCRYSSSKAPGSSSANIGFRCCANAK